MKDVFIKRTQNEFTVGKNFSVFGIQLEFFITNCWNLSKILLCNAN